METEDIVKTRDYTGVTTEQIVTEMLTENTGRGICDSGDHYGRNWSNNQTRDFTHESEVRCTWSVWRKSDSTEPGRAEMCGTVSLYHWLNDHFEFDAELQAELDQYAEHEAPESHWLGLSEEFANHLHAMGRGESEPNVINTYNDPDNIDLSQVLQYTQLFLEDCHEPSHLIINVHGGCDVRGGYASPKVMKLTTDYYEALDHARVKTLCAGDHSWDYGYGNDCDPSDNAPDKNILTLPCYDLDWLEDERLVELDALIVRIDRDQTTLKEGGTLTPERTLELEAARASATLERIEIAADVLTDMHAAATYVHDRKLFLVYIAEGQCGDPVTEEVKAYNE